MYKNEVGAARHPLFLTLIYFDTHIILFKHTSGDINMMTFTLT